MINLLNKKTLLRVSAIAVGLLLFFVLPQNGKFADDFFVRISSAIVNGNEPDSNIVLVTITESDIEALGGWPLKRSYYALLINHLTKLKVKKIGLEVFLSDKISAQSVYDNLLVNEINKAGNVVAASMPIGVAEINNRFIADSIEFPAVKKNLEKLQTGHINYFEERFIKLPSVISYKELNEKAFSLQLADATINTSELLLNFNFQWSKFRHYELIEFFNLANEGNLHNLEDKIILIGVTDPQYCAKIETAFDDFIPGLALHAFVVDNFQKGNFLTLPNFFLQIVIALLAPILLIFISTNKEFSRGNLVTFYSIATILTISIITILLANNIAIFSLLVILPLLILLVVDVYYLINSKLEVIQEVVEEAEALKILLQKKEAELKKIENQLTSNRASKDELLESKINQLKDEISRLKSSGNDEKALVVDSTNAQNFFGMVFKSKVMRNVTEFISKVAQSEETILITGESGTGKELAAQAVHKLSKRSNEKFIAVNCGALSETLLESELFGHVKGAFTGASIDKAGRFEAANNGTIFLDEIGEISENFQVKLLRVLQAGEFEKVGSSITKKVNVRVVAATNKNLEKLVKEEKFREDLYYRLNVIKVHLPSLRERKEDIPLIVNYIISKNKNKNLGITSSAIDAMVNYEWKGNVRELESAVKRASVIAMGYERDLIQITDLPDGVVKNHSLNYEDIVIESLRLKNFSHSAFTDTAKELGVNRTVISENFRGLCFKAFVENSFNKEDAIKYVADTDDKEIVEKLLSKLDLFLKNIYSDIEKHKGSGLEKVKESLASKYKNLPKKFHVYLDEVINHYFNKP